MVIRLVNSKQERKIEQEPETRQSRAEAPAAREGEEANDEPEKPVKVKRMQKLTAPKPVKRARKSAGGSPRLMVGRRLSAAMAYRQQRAEVVATQAGITRQTLWRYETGQTKPDLLSMVALATVLGVRLEWLATGKEPMLEPDET